MSIDFYIDYLNLFTKNFPQQQCLLKIYDYHKNFTFKHIFIYAVVHKIIILFTKMFTKFSYI